MIEPLQRAFAIPGAVGIVAGEGGLPKVVLTHATCAAATVYLHGAQVTAWQVDEQELLFLSEESRFAPTEAIRGGVPIIFPQFGDGPLPKHGLARTRAWQLLRTAREDSGAVTAILGLEASPDTLQVWPHRFALTLQVTLEAKRLTLALSVTNRDAQPFAFAAVFHSYFRVADIRRTAVRGLQGVSYLDSLRGGARAVEDRAEIRFAEEVDRIYVNTPDQLAIDDAGNGRTIRLATTSMPDAVVWNPWIAKAQRLPDFGDAEYQQMVCVETGAIASKPTLAPAATWQGSTVLSVE